MTLWHLHPTIRRHPFVKCVLKSVSQKMISTYQEPGALIGSECKTSCLLKFELNVIELRRRDRTRAQEIIRTRSCDGNPGTSSARFSVFLQARFLFQHHDLLLLEQTKTRNVHNPNGWDTSVKSTRCFQNDPSMSMSTVTRLNSRVTERWAIGTNNSPSRIIYWVLTLQVELHILLLLISGPSR